MNNNHSKTKLEDILKFCIAECPNKKWIIENTFVGRQIYFKKVGIDFGTQFPEGLAQDNAKLVVSRCNAYEKEKVQQRERTRNNKRPDTFVPTVPERKKKIEITVSIETNALLTAKALELGIPSDELAGQAIAFALERMGGD